MYIIVDTIMSTYSENLLHLLLHVNPFNHIVLHIPSTKPVAVIEFI